MIHVRSVNGLCPFVPITPLEHFQIHHHLMLVIIKKASKRKDVSSKHLSAAVKWQSTKRMPKPVNQWRKQKACFPIGNGYSYIWELLCNDLKITSKGSSGFLGVDERSYKVRLRWSILKAVQSSIISELAFSALWEVLVEKSILYARKTKTRVK